MRVLIHNNYQEMSKWAAYYTAGKIKETESEKKRPFILGLPTGSTPIGTYKELIKLHKAGKLSFKNVVTFNMDEYIGIPEDHPQSYHYYMESNFFKDIDLPKENIHILNGNAPDLEKECEDYEKMIVEAGGIDLFLGGIGSDGHIAFNEPGSSLNSQTRVKALTYDTRIANSRFFDHDINKVPKYALTVGVKTVMDADEVVILINGYGKAEALQATVEGGINHMCTVSALQLHEKAMILCDKDATMKLKVETAEYFKNIEKEALENLPELE